MMIDRVALITVSDYAIYHELVYNKDDDKSQNVYIYRILMIIFLNKS